MRSASCAMQGFSWGRPQISMSLQEMKGSRRMQARDLTDCVALYLKYIEPTLVGSDTDIWLHGRCVVEAPFSVLGRAALSLGSRAPWL